MGEETFENSRKRPYDESPNDGYYNKRSNSGSGNSKPLLKILVPNFIAGKLIGKGGANINELQSRYSASIQLSANKEFYPGTEDRIVTVSAEKEQIIRFTSYMIEHVLEEPESERNVRHDVKLVVTNVAAGLVIGKGGATIKDIQEQSSAKINISKRDGCISNERVLVISGDVPQRLDACGRIIEKMAEEPDKMSSSTVKYSSLNNSIQLAQNGILHNNLQANSSNILFNGIANGLAHTISSIGNNYDSNYIPKSKVKARFIVEMEVPDNMVGSLLGKQGQTINELSRASGAKFQFSPKNDFAPGTTDRILTITGGMNQVQNAYKLVDQKIAQVELESIGNLRRT